MKTKVFLLTLLLAAFSVSGQSSRMSENDNTPPVYRGEQPLSIQEFLVNNIVYPEQSLKMQLEGTEVIEFLVKTNGELDDFKVINSVSPEIDLEVMRVIRMTSGQWAPAIADNEMVDRRHELSVTFKRTSTTNFVERAKIHFTKGNHLLFVENKPKKALKFLNRAYMYLPNEESVLASRSLCRYSLGDETGANNDLNRLKDIAARNGKPVGDIYFSENADTFLHVLARTDISAK